MAGYAGKMVRVLVILAAQPFVVIQRRRQMHFVTAAAEPRLPVQRLQECLLVKCRLGLDQLPIDPAQKIVVAKCEWIMYRCSNRVIGVASGAVDAGDRVASSAGDAGARQRIVRNAEVQIIVDAGEQRYRVVAAGTKT